MNIESRTLITQLFYSVRCYHIKCIPLAEKVISLFVTSKTVQQFSTVHVLINTVLCIHVLVDLHCLPIKLHSFNSSFPVPLWTSCSFTLCLFPALRDMCFFNY